MNLNRDYSISAIRFIATFFIITCHIMQYSNLELAWWFNVGVQIFLCMSGYLYGKKKNIDDDISFYKKNFFKILLDYYIVVIPIIILFWIFLPEQISIAKTIMVLLTYDTLNGGEHLWYIPYCLFCYAITPFIHRYFKSSKNIIQSFIFISLFSIFLTETFFSYFKSAWIFCYILGFFLGFIEEYKTNNIVQIIPKSIIALAIIFNFIQITQDYIVRLNLNGYLEKIYYLFCNYAHVFLGVSLFIILKNILSSEFVNKYPYYIKKALNYSDKFSYDIYLVHQFLILGPLSLMDVTHNLIANILIISVLFTTIAIIVNFTSAKLRLTINHKCY